MGRKIPLQKGFLFPPPSVLLHRFLNLLPQLFDGGDEGDVLDDAVDEERGEVRQADLAHEREVLGEHD